MRLVRSILPAVASFAAACGASDPSFASLRAARPTGGDASVISPRTGSLTGKKQRAKKKTAALTASANTARLRNGLRTPSPSSAMMTSSAAGAAAPEKPALRIDTAARAEEGRVGPFAHLSRPASPAERRGMRESLASKAKARQQLSRRLSEEVHRKLRDVFGGAIPLQFGPILASVRSVLVFDVTLKGKYPAAKVASGSYARDWMFLWCQMWLP